MTAGDEPLDTAALRERGPYITSMASDGYPSICVDTDSWNAMANEIDRLRAALSAVGVGAAPAETVERCTAACSEHHTFMASCVLRASAETRYAGCIEQWPDCESGAYHPSCCRFPKSCSCEKISGHAAEGDDLLCTFAYPSGHVCGHRQDSHVQRADSVHVQQPAEVIASVTLPANTIKVGDRIDLRQPAEPCDDGCCKNSPCDFEPSAGAGSPSTPTPAVETRPDGTHDYRDLGNDGGGCVYIFRKELCGRQPDHPVHVQRDERAERGDGGGRDPHCALSHPHGRSNRCAGD